MHETDRGLALKRLAGAAVAELYLTVSLNRHTLPLLAVIEVFLEILHDLRAQHFAVLRLEVLEAAVCVVVCHLEHVHDVVLVRAVKDRGAHVEAEHLGSEREVNLLDLSNVHTRRHAERVQHNVERAAVRQEGHILDRKHARHNTLVAVAACHLVADRNLSLLCDVNADILVHARGELIAVLSRKDTRLHDRAVGAVRHLERGVADFSGLLAEDCTEQSLLRRQLGLALRRHLADQNVTGANLRTDADDAVVIEIPERVVADTRDISRDLLRAELRVARCALVLLNVNRGEDIILHETLGEKNRVLVVITLPGHETDQRVLAETDLAVVGRRTVRDDLAFLDMVARVHDGLLVVGVRLVRALELREFVVLDLAVVVAAHRDFAARAHHDRARVARNLADAGVDRRLCLHAGANDRRIGQHERNGLTLHVRAHQCAVCVVVLEERDHARRDREDHLRRDVHEIDEALLERRSLFFVSAGDIVVDKVPLFVERLVCLCDNEIVFFIRREIHDIIRDARILRVLGFIDHAVGRLDKAVGVDARVARKRVDEADVRTLGGLDRAHSAVVRVVDVSNLETCAVSRETARAEGRESSLVRELRERVVLVHELRELRRTEELFDRRRDRLDVNQGLRRNLADVLGRHALSDHALHAGQTDAVLVLQELADRADAAVAKVVNVIGRADALFDLHVVVDRSKNVFLRDVLRNQAIHMPLHVLLDVDLVLLGLLQDFHERRIVDRLHNAVFGRILHVDIVADIDHEVREHLQRALGRARALHHHIRNARVLNLGREFSRDHRAALRENLAGVRIHGIL